MLNSFMRLQDKFFYDPGFCYPISHERISGELAICCSKNPKSLEVYHILFQQQTEYHNKHNNTKIKHNNDCFDRINDKYAQCRFI